MSRLVEETDEQRRARAGLSDDDLKADRDKKFKDACKEKLPGMEIPCGTKWGVGGRARRRPKSKSRSKSRGKSRTRSKSKGKRKSKSKK